MVGGENGSSGDVLKSKGDGTFEWGDAINPPTFSSVDYPGDDTAADPAGGQNLVINGTNFSSGITCTIGGTTPSSITLNSSTQMTVVSPAKAAGGYVLIINNTDGGSATVGNAITYNGIPAFSVAAGSLGSSKSGSTVSLSTPATEPDGGAITYAITSGALPSGLSFNTSTSAITGTAPEVSAATTSNFTVTATDNENQSTSRAYSITITPILATDSFDITTYTGNGGTKNITGLSFQPDFVWIKKRNADNEHILTTTRVGIGEQFRPSYNSAGRDTNTNRITSLNSDGFTLGSDGQVNTNNHTYVAYSWKVNGGTSASNSDGSTTSTVEVNTDQGISMISYGGTGSNATVGHGLGKVPEFIMMMDRYNGGGWRIWHKDLTSASYYLDFTTGQQTSSSGMWNNTRPTSSVFSLGTNAPANGSGRQHICWAFTSIPGFSKIGSYIGNNSQYGEVVELGFEPAFVIIKNSTAIYNWVLYDNKRSTQNYRQNVLYPNTSIAENADEEGRVDFYSNGFRVRSTHGTINQNGAVLIYIAFAGNPDTTAPTLADSFNTKTYTGNSSTTQSITGVGFRPDLVWQKSRSNTYSNYFLDSLRGRRNSIISNSSGADNPGSADGNDLVSFDTDGMTFGPTQQIYGKVNGATYVTWNWKANDNEPTIHLKDALAVYKFEDNANDVTTNNNGTASNVSYVTGKLNKAAQFNGTSSYIDTNFTLPAISEYSISLWFNTTSTASWNDFLADNPSNGAGLGARIIFAIKGGSTFHVAISNGSSFWSDNTTVSATPYRDGNWHHAVLSINGSTVKLYVDNVLLNTYSSSVSAGTAGSRSITLGRLGDYNGEYFNGKLDQVRFIKGAVNATGVSRLYNETVDDNNDLTLGAPEDAIINANQNAGFSMVTYKGDGVAGREVPHGLSSAPTFIIAKTLESSAKWRVYHSALGGTKYVNLNDAYGAGTSSNIWNDFTPTTTKFQVGSDLTPSGEQLIAYCWHSVTGYSKFGSYTGNGSATGPTVTTGFQPNFLMVKDTTNDSTNWRIVDSVRGTDATDGSALFPNLNNAEQTDGTQHAVEFQSNGFQIRNATSGWNNNNATHIYMAFKIN